VIRFWLPCYKKVIVVVSFVSVAALPRSAFSEYVAVGPFQGQVCSGFIIEACGHEKLEAVKKDGKFYEINRVWQRVDEYKPPVKGSSGLCFVRLNEGVSAFLGGRPDFYGYNEAGQLEKVDVDGYLRFNCRKQ